MTSDSPASDPTPEPLPSHRAAPRPVGEAPSLDDRTDVVVALSYYAPYVSGLTNTARDVAEGLAARGLRVAVVTTRHDPALPAHEVVGGVAVHRAPVLLRIGKGPVSPALPAWVLRAARRSRVLHLHAPMLEAGPLARAAQLAGVPVVTTYHCDVSLPPGAVNAVTGAVMDASSRAAARASARVVVTSDDYARHSRIWPVLEGKHVAVPPPCHPRDGGRPVFRRGSGPHVGFLGRIVEEKGLEHLVAGFRALEDPHARLLIGGDFSAIAGGSVVDRVRAAIGDDPRVVVLGFLPDEDIADFHASLDVFALTSVNSFEAFGIVQVEAMMAGVPSLASDLPGVRRPVEATGFGVVVPPRSAEGITQGLHRLLEAAPDRVEGARRARELYTPEVVVDGYQQVLDAVARPR